VSFIFANNVQTTLASAASSTSTTLTLASSANLPTLATGQMMPITLNDVATGTIYEICYVTAISGPTLTVERAQEGTAAQNWSVGDYAFSAMTAGTGLTTNSVSATTETLVVSTSAVVPAATASNQAVQASQLSYVAPIDALQTFTSVTTGTLTTATLTAPCAGMFLVLGTGASSVILTGEYFSTSPGSGTSVVFSNDMSNAEVASAVSVCTAPDGGTLSVTWELVTGSTSNIVIALNIIFFPFPII